MLFRDWVSVTGKEIKEMLDLNDDLIILNGYIFKVSQKDLFDNDKEYTVLTVDDELVVLDKNLKEVLRRRGKRF